MDYDFSFTDHGSVTILTPLTQDAREWVEQNIPEDAQRWAGGVVIEPRYAPNILEGLAGDGLTCAA
jgi:hypothetical protein